MNEQSFNKYEEKRDEVLKSAIEKVDEAREILMTLYATDSLSFKDDDRASNLLSLLDKATNI